MRDGPVLVDHADGAATSFSAYYVFNGRSQRAKNWSGDTNDLSIQPAASSAVGIGGRGLACIASLTSYATPVSTTDMGISGALSRTVFVRILPNAASSSSNLGGVFSVGNSSGTNSLFSVRQYQAASPYNIGDAWCLDYGTSVIPFLMANTPGIVHTIVVTYTANTLTVFTDGRFNLSQVVTLNTAQTAFDVGRCLISPDDTAHHFNGKVIEVGVTRNAWDNKQVLEWHGRPTRFTKLSALRFSNPVGSNSNIQLIGIPSTSSVGTPTASVNSQTPYNIQLNGILSTSSIGTMSAALGTGIAQFVALIGIPSTAAIGTMTGERQSGFWLQQPAASGDWVPVTTVTGG